MSVSVSLGLIKDSDSDSGNPIAGRIILFGVVPFVRQAGRQLFQAGGVQPIIYMAEGVKFSKTPTKIIEIDI